MFNSNSTWIEYLWREHRLSRSTIRQLVQHFVDFSNFKLSFKNPWPENIRIKPTQFSKLASSLQSEVQYSGSSFPFLTYMDSHYPAELHHLHDPPVLLYGLGDFKYLKQPRPWVAIVGTRYASSYALQACEKIIKEIQEIRPLILSGMALGIDGKAHRVALQENLVTIGVVGNSLDKVYPLENKCLFSKMSEEALILSEVYPGAEMGKWRFPERNRILAALADIIIVVEAPAQSGALVTAEFALELGREVFVVPGPITSNRNLGGHRLIQQGAQLLTDGKEIFSFQKVKNKYLKTNSNILSEPKSAAIVSKEKDSSYTASNQYERQILDLLKEKSLHIDKIVEISHLAAPLVTATLMELSLKGVVTELGRGIFELN